MTTLNLGDFFLGEKNDPRMTRNEILPPSDDPIRPNCPRFGAGTDWEFIHLRFFVKENQTMFTNLAFCLNCNCSIGGH